MGDKLSVHPESLLRASARFALESEQLAYAVGRLRASLGPLGGMCGNDEQGQKFASGYDPNSKNLDQALQNLTRGLEAIGQGLEAMGINYQGSDAASQVNKGP